MSEEKIENIKELTSQFEYLVYIISNHLTSKTQLEHFEWLKNEILIYINNIIKN